MAMGYALKPLAAPLARIAAYRQKDKSTIDMDELSINAREAIDYVMDEGQNLIRVSIFKQVPRWRRLVRPAEIEEPRRWLEGNRHTRPRCAHLALHRVRPAAVSRNEEVIRLNVRGQPGAVFQDTVSKDQCSVRFCQ